MQQKTMSEDKGKKKGWLTHAFAVPKAADFAASDREIEVLDTVAARVVKHGLATPAILFLESVRPLNFIGSQAMAFFEPLIRGVFSGWDGYTDFYKIMERRGSVECLMDRIEKAEEDRQALIEKNKALAKAEKAARKAAKGKKVETTSSEELDSTRRE